VAEGIARANATIAKLNFIVYYYLISFEKEFLII
jgi:hypothetical protein